MLLPTRWARLLPDGIPRCALPALSPCSLTGRSSRPSSRRSSSSSTSASSKVRLRFAPSPTGYLHLGGLRTALFNHLLARRMGGKWILRIEDTDQARYVEGAVESLLKTLAWAKLDFDEGPGRGGDHMPYFQSQRRTIYDRYLQPMIDSGKAYHCFCSVDRLAQVRKELQKSGSSTGYDRKCMHLSPEESRQKSAKGEASIVRFKSSSDGLTQTDIVYDSITYVSLPIEDFVLRKSDGLPTYHFANVVDDHEMGVTHVLRGEEWLPSTPKHLALYAALNITPPLFAHMPLMVNPDGSKLSKRAGDVRVEDYITQGYEPESLLNFVALMGWSNQGAAAAVSTSSAEVDTSEVMSLQDLIDNFSLEGINKNRATMSSAKLSFFNRAHIQRKVMIEESRNEMAERLRVLLVDRFPTSELLEVEYIGRVIAALKERIFTINDILNIGGYFFLEPDLSTPAAAAIFNTTSVDLYVLALKATLSGLQQLPDSAFGSESHEVIGEMLGGLKLKDERLAKKSLMNPLRHALTGEKVGAGIAATMGTLGRASTVRRLEAALLRI